MQGVTRKLTNPQAGDELQDLRRPLYRRSQRVVHAQGWENDDLTGGARYEETGFCTLGETEHVESAHEGRLDRLDGVVLIMWR